VAGSDAGETKPRRRIVGTAGVAATALIVALFTAIGTGIGSKALHAFDDEEAPLVSSSAREELSECGTSLFVPGARVHAVAADRPPSSWSAFQRANDARVADRSVVTVSIQGESSRPITLTGIRFEVERHRRPAGAVFALPCGGGVTGRSVQADLDRRPVAITRSNEDPRASLDEATQRRPRPIRFPWTVSLTDPLLLTIVATTQRCACTWRATIDWVSGGKSGTLAVDAGGRGYTVVGLHGAPLFVAGGPGNRWQALS
jgi:hypothetical protein